MYTFARNVKHEFDGDLVLDMFNGSGTTCVAAKGMGRNWIGIDLNPAFCATVERRRKNERVDPPKIKLQAVRVRAPENSRQIGLFEETEDDGPVR